jgi:hypothetical protein
MGSMPNLAMAGRNSTTELYDETYSLRDTFIDLILQRWMA